MFRLFYAFKYLIILFCIDFLIVGTQKFEIIMPLKMLNIILNNYVCDILNLTIMLNPWFNFFIYPLNRNPHPLQSFKFHPLPSAFFSAASILFKVNLSYSQIRIYYFVDPIQINLFHILQKFENLFGFDQCWIKFWFVKIFNGHEF